MRTLIAAFALLGLASTATAGIPMAGNSTLPPNIRVVATNGSQADPAGLFTVTVRDLANNPVAGSSVMVDFAALSDVRLGTNQFDAGVFLNCPHRYVRRNTDAAGTASFIVVGRGSGTVGRSGPQRANIYADGLLIGTVPVVVFDLDGAGGVGANDMSLWMDDYGTLQPVGRGDYDGNGYLSANDLSIWLSVAGTGGSSVSVTLVCP